MSLAKRARRAWMIAPALACSVIMGCNDDDGDDEPRGDGGPAIDAGGMDASMTADGGLPDGGGDAGSVASFAGAVSRGAPLSADAADLDRLAAAAFGEDGKIYAAGYVQKTAGGVTDRQMAVARFGTDGNLDTTWGTGGVVLVNANVATASAPDTIEAAKGIGFQSDGRIVITGIVPRGKTGTPELDQVDVAVARLTSVGALDSTYAVGDVGGVAGVAIVNLGPAAQRTNNTTTSTINDDAYGLAIDAMDRTIVFARGKAEAPARTDWDRYVLRFTPAGALDPTFAGDGKYSYDVEGTNTLDDNTRNGLALAGNKILSAGYTNIAMKNTIGLLRLNEDGTEDATFGTGGKVMLNPLGPNGMAEAYGVALQSNGSYVTIGYGNEGAPPNKVVSFRFTPAGAKDTTFGVAGNVLFDLQADADQGRNIVALSDDRLLAVGNSNSAMGMSDGLALMMSKDGRVTHAQAFDFGRSTEQLLGLAVSRDGTYAAGVGYSSGGMSGPDDGAIWVYRLKP
jgi:uncharacterized delta-60 repeat protein